MVIDFIIKMGIRMNKKQEDEIPFIYINLVCSIILGYIFAFIFNYRPLGLYDRTGMYIVVLHGPAIFYAIMLFGLFYIFKEPIERLTN